jgi:protein-tyrosine phosphatase
MPRPGPGDLRTLLTIDRPYRVLVVCTANQCRSPLAAATLARRMEVAGVRGETFSAGTNVGISSPATPEAVNAARELWFDLADHKSSPLDTDAVGSADLVLGMTRAHAREAVVLESAAYWRTFTLKELVRRGEARPRGAETFSDWLWALATERNPEELLGTSPDDDVSDPIGQPLSVFRKTLTELDDLADRLVRVAWPKSD